MRSHLSQIVTLFLIAACSAPQEAGIDPGTTLSSIDVSPGRDTLIPGATRSFSATGHYSNGSTDTVSVIWTATGGTIGTDGVFQAGGAVGTYRVVATAMAAARADTADVVIRAATSMDGLSVTPALDTLLPGEPQNFVATAHFDDGSTSAAAVNWSATGGTINSSGRYTAGSTAGTYRVVAVTTTGGFADTSVVVIRPATSLDGVVVSPALDTLQTGAQRNFTATAHYTDGSTGAAIVSWTATGGTINSSGRYTAGNTVGTYRVVATTTTGGFADTSTVVIKAAPVTLSAVVVTPPSVTVDPGSTTTFTATGQYSDGSSGAVAVNWTATGGSVNASGVYTAGAAAGTYRIIATATAAARADTSQITIRDTTTPPTGGTVLVDEPFNDANVGPRGWYANTDPAISTTQQHAGAGALELRWTPGATIPIKGVSLRRQFTASSTLYIRYWVKYSSNFVGSGLSYHPHEFTLLTNEDGQWIGPSLSHLGILMEHHWTGGSGYPRLSAGDALNVDPTKIGVDLTNVTEQRAANGCNGETDGYHTDCFQNGPDWYNQKEWTSATASMNSSAGAANKNNWHKVEVYLQLNSIAGGKGQTNGVAQFSVDGQLKLDLHNVLFRTGAFPNMKFNQILIAGYIGDGSPADQTMWIDDLIIATAPVP